MSYDEAYDEVEWVDNEITIYILSKSFFRYIHLEPQEGISKIVCSGENCDLCKVDTKQKEYIVLVGQKEYLGISAKMFVYDDSIHNNYYGDLIISDFSCYNITRNGYQVDGIKNGYRYIYSIKKLDTDNKMRENYGLSELKDLNHDYFPKFCAINNYR